MAWWKGLIVGVALVFCLVSGPQPGATQTTIEFCRDVSLEGRCVGPSRVFATAAPHVAALVVISQRAPYTVTGQWQAPDGSTYLTLSHKEERTGTLRLGFRMFVLGRRAETLPGEWAMHVHVDDRLVASATFTLQLVGERKYWIDAVGPTFVLKAVTARRIESGEAVDETTEFKAAEPVHAFVSIGFPPVSEGRAGASVGILWRWISPSGERLERRTQTSPFTVGTNSMRFVVAP